MSKDSVPENTLSRAREIAKRLREKYFTPEMIESAIEAEGDKSILIGCKHAWGESHYFEEPPNGDDGAWCICRKCSLCGVIQFTDQGVGSKK